MNYRYSPTKRQLIRLYRVFRPSINSPYTKGPIDDICKVQLVDPDKMQSFFMDCIRILQELKGKDIGDYFEFGVFNGASLSNMYFAAQKAGVSMRMFGFDAFEGLPAESEKEDAGVWGKGFYSCSFPQLRSCLKRKGIDPEGITWIKGWYKDTLNEATAKKHSISNPGIVFIDCDTYSSSKSALDFLAPLIRAPVIINLDDWRLYDLDLKDSGEYRSFNEFLEANPHLKAEEIGTYKRNSRSFLVTPK